MSEQSSYPTLLCVRGYPRELRDRVAEAAKTSDLNANDYIVAVLADDYDYAFEPGTRPLRAKRSSEFGAATPGNREPGTTLQLNLPAGLNHLIHMDAARNRTLVRDLVLSKLARHLRVRYDTPVIRRGRKKVVA